MEPCGKNTGYTRNGFCGEHARDFGRHTVCATLTPDFLAFTRAQGNGLDGLQAADRWCICESRYEQAKQAGVPPIVHPESSAYGFSR